jgi:hypothetical protein
MSVDGRAGGIPVISAGCREGVEVDRRCRVTAQSTWKKSVASIVAACAYRNFRHVVSVRRWGAGGTFSAFRTRRIVDALTR